MWRLKRDEKPILIDRFLLSNDNSPNHQMLDEYLSNKKQARNPVLSCTRSRTMIPKSKVAHLDAIKLGSPSRTTYDLLDFLKNRKLSCYTEHTLIQFLKKNRTKENFHSKIIEPLCTPIKLTKQFPEPISLHSKIPIKLVLSKQEFLEPSLKKQKVKKLYKQKFRKQEPQRLKTQNNLTRNKLPDQWSSWSVESYEDREI